jgi:hypothetical protein
MTSKYENIILKERIKAPKNIPKDKKYCKYGNHEDITDKPRLLDINEFYNYTSTCKECYCFDTSYRRYKKNKETEINNEQDTEINDEQDKEINDEQDKEINNKLQHKEINNDRLQDKEIYIYIDSLKNMIEIQKNEINNYKETFKTIIDSQNNEINKLKKEIKNINDKNEDITKLLDINRSKILDIINELLKCDIYIDIE